MDDELVIRVALGGPSTTAAERADPRVLRSRAAVVEAATALFLERGYVDTSVDDIAAMASVSKKTVYNNFLDKERLFTEIVLGITATAEQLADDLVASLADVPDSASVAGTLHALARRHLTAACRPSVVRLRRLVSAESRRFPELAREYHRRAPGRVVGALTTAFSDLHRRGLLQVPDAQRGAEHFAFLVVGATLDRVMFEGEASLPSAPELERRADAAVQVFLAAYGVE